MSDAPNEELAKRWVDGLTGNWSILEALCSPTMQVWHSHDNVWLKQAEAAARMAASGEGAPALAFEDARATSTETGFIIQASIKSVDGTGRTHIVQVLTVEDGRVAVCEEYIAPEMNLGI